MVGFLEEGLLRGQGQLCRRGSGGPGRSESMEGSERKPVGIGGTGCAHKVGWHPVVTVQESLGYDLSRYPIQSLDTCPTEATSASIPS